MAESAEKPQKTRVTPLPSSNLCILTNASEADISTPATRLKSTIKNRIGFFCQDGPLIRSRMVSSMHVIVPKNKKPAKKTYVVMQMNLTSTYPANEE